jgi:pimeloyl-ACP methyl ester carboxylesterase
MAKAKVNGIEIDYEDTGRGRAIVLTHGHTSGRTAWDGQHQALADRYRVISWDIRGHGQTLAPDDPAQYSLPLTVADIRALLGHLGIARAVIGGLSLGGYVSLAFYLAHPEMVEALVICDSGPGYRNEQARAQWNERAFARAAELDTKGLESLAGRSREVQETRSRHRSARALAHATRGILAQQGSAVIDGLPSITVPTLVIVGEQDTPFLGPSEYMAKKIRGARLETIAGAGHSANLDQPDAFNRVLLSFLDSLPPGRQP